MLKVGHSVTVPQTLRGKNTDPEPQTVPIPEELETVPGIPQDPLTVDFYTRQYPIESQNVENVEFRNWNRAISDIPEIRAEYEKGIKPLVRASAVSGDVEPTVEPVPGKDVTQEIKAKAMELGFGVVGITAYDNRYTYVSKRRWVKPFPHTICLAYEQPYETTQMIPSEIAEKGAFDTYVRMGAVGLELADYIRSLGYHAQVQSTGDASSAVIPMFVAAGLGQLGASGYLLSPHFGSRHRLMMITTDAIVAYDQPVDFGIHAFCQICQVCVNRCPGRALMREKVWWRGVEKFKLLAKRCRPVMARYAACGVCMKVCPVQRYGLKPVMEHYVETGQVLGKGTHGLEGYEMHDLGYFGPGELPKFSSDFFHVPDGLADQNAFERLKQKMAEGQIPEGPEGLRVLEEFRKELAAIMAKPADAMAAEMDETDDIDEF